MGYYGKRIFYLLIFLICFNARAQDKSSVWFSETGDTVLFLSSAYQDDQGIWQNVFDVQERKKSSNQSTLIERITLKSEDSIMKIVSLPEKVKHKYNLTRLGESIVDYDKYGISLNYEIFNEKKIPTEFEEYEIREFYVNLELKFHENILFKKDSIPISFSCYKDYKNDLDGGIANFQVWKMKDFSNFHILLYFTESSFPNEEQLVTGRIFEFRYIVKNNP